MHLASSNRVIALCLVILLGGIALQTVAGYSSRQIATAQTWGNDDAYISYRYARNLARGHGLVFNPGERVEGYSDFLYVLLLTPAFFFIDGGAIYGFAVFLNMLAIIGAFLIFYAFVRERLGDGWAGAAGVLFVLCPPLWAGVASGMETGLVLLLQLVIWVAVERLTDRPAPRTLRILCLAISLLILIRADGFVAPVIAITYLLIKKRFHPAMVCGIVAALTIGVHFAWRYHYYGYPLPNSYYAKVAGTVPDRIVGAFKQLAALLAGGGVAPYLLVLVGVVLFTLKKFLEDPLKALREISFAPFFGIGWILYWIYVGGDNLVDRFLLILVPMGIFVLLGSLQRIRQRRWVFYFVALVVLVESSALALDKRFVYSFRKYDGWIAAGKYLKEKHPGKTIAVGAAGKIPFYSDLRTIDMFGLNDIHIAHQPPALRLSRSKPGHVKFDPDYVLSKSPNLILGWIGPTRDLRLGLPRQKYEGAGYRLRYLVNARSEPFAKNVIDVLPLSESAVANLWQAGYRYGIVEKRLPRSEGSAP
jgi:arabinofuranosyltransferase